MELRSNAWANGGAIPPKYTCEGEDVSPVLHWEGAPEGTVSFALIVEDPDAPDPARPRPTPYVHWILCGIPARATSLPEGVEEEDLPEGTIVGLNDWGRTRYGGPCPPIGRHRYFFRLFALDIRPSHLLAPTKSELEDAMKGHLLAEAQLIGTYEKGAQPSLDVSP